MTINPLAHMHAAIDRASKPTDCDYTAIITADDFVQALRCLCNLDGPALKPIGFCNEDVWNFVRSPWRIFLALPPKQQAAIWRLVQQRLQPAAAKQREAPDVR